MKHIFTVLLAFLFISVTSAQSNSIFGYLGSDGNFPVAINVLIEGDNNHFYATAFDYGINASVLFKCDQNGNIVWQKQLNLNESGTGTNAVEIGFYNNYIYVLTENPYGVYNYTLAKMDVLGNLAWARTLTPVDSQAYHKPSLDFGPTGEIIVASSTFSSVELFSLNEDGSENWIRNCSSDSTEYKNPNFDIASCDDGDVMGACKAGSDMCFYRMNSDGSLDWSKRILEMDQSYTHIKSIRQINSNLFVACGYRIADMWSADPGKGFYALLDGSGNFISFTMVNELGEILNAFPLDNGNFLLEGFTSVTYHFAFIEINSAGTIINSYHTDGGTLAPSTYEGIADINGHLFIGDANYIQKLDNIVPTECFNYQNTTFTLIGDDPGSDPSSNYFVMHPEVGTITPNSMANLQPASLQLVHGCALTAGINDPLVSNVKVFPTLLNNNDLIFVEHEMTGEVQYQIMDINGKMVEQNVLANSSVMINGLSAGLYVLQLTNNGNVVYHSKFVVN